MKTEAIKLDDLSNDPANVRVHSGRNLDAIKASLARFGQQKPIVVDENNVVRAGNGTLDAARALGWTELNCVRSELGRVDLTAFAIADNRTAELADWDWASLGAVVKDLAADGYDLASIGFEAAELGVLMHDADEGEEQELQLEAPPIDLSYKDAPTEAATIVVAVKDESLLEEVRAAIVAAVVQYEDAVVVSK